MPKPRHFLLLLALATLAAVGYVMRESKARTAEALLASADRRLAQAAPDFDAALRDLDLALELALRDGQRNVAQQIYSTRARTYARRGLLDRARADYSTALADYAPESAHLRVSIGWIDLQLGNPDLALAAAGEALAREPGHADALTLRGRALWTMGALALDEVRALADVALPDEEADRAFELAWRAATLDFGHPHRTATISEIARLFGGRETFEIERHVDAATTSLVQARASFVAALATHPHPGAMAALLELFQHGGQWSDVVDFGLAATAHAEVQVRLSALEALVEALDVLDRPAFASSILSEASEAQVTMPPALMATWCRLLYEAGDWRRLEQVGRETVVQAGADARDLAATASLYKGFANLNLQRYQPASEDFRAYTQRPPRTPPMPDALGWAFYGQAQAQHGQNRPQDELLYLERAVEAAPELDAELWVALAEAQLVRRQPASVAAESLARAVTLADARRRPEILARWEELSKEAMVERQRNLDAIELGAKDQGQKVLANDDRAPTWEWYALGQRYVERKDGRGAVEAARAILARYPDHVLGLDLWIEGAAIQRAWRKLVDLLLQRAARHGPYARTEELLARLPAGVLKEPEVLRLMELDPHGTGLMRMVQTLVTEGRDALAVDTLAALDPLERPPQATRLLAELYAEAGLWSQALETAALVPTGSPEFSRAFELALASASAMRKPGVFDRLVPELLGRLAEAELEPVAIERAARWLLAMGHLKGAGKVYETLDAPEVRGATGLVGLGLTLTAAGRFDQAREALDRADAFTDGPDPLLARIALLAAEGRFGEIPAEVDRLRATGFQPTPWVDAALLALSERVREAAAAASEAALAPGAEPECWLVLGAANALLPEEDRRPADGDPYPDQTEVFVHAAGEPRNAFVQVALLSTPTGAAYVQRSLTATAGDAGRVWPSWLGARAMDALGHPDHARNAIEALLRVAPKLAVGWDRLEADLVALRGTPLCPEMPALYERRFDALGPDPKRPVEALVVKAQKLVRDGAAVDALEAFERARASVEKSALGLVSRARLLRVAGLLPEAVQSFAAGLAKLQPDEAALLVDEFLALGTQAFQQRSISAAAWRAHLEALRAQLPRRPTVALAWARVERQTAPQPVEGWSLARAEYDRFRRETDGVALDVLEPGSAAQWAAFFLSENPREAETMIRGELEKSCGSPDLWRLLGDALEEQGRIDEAFDRYVALTRILPEPETLRRAARILATRGSDHGLLQATIDKIRAVERATGPDAELELLRALSLAHGDPQGVQLSLRLFEVLWERQSALRAPWQRLELATGYAVALLHGGDPADGPRIAAILQEALPRVQDPYRRDVLTAFLHMAPWMPEPALSSSLDGEDGEDGEGAEGAEEG